MEIIPDSTLGRMEEAILILKFVWNNHRDRIGQHIEHIFNYATDPSITKYVISSLLGIITYLFVG